MVPRFLQHTAQALKVYEMRELWEKYGLVGDLVVSEYVCYRINLTFFLAFCRRFSPG